MTDTRKEFEEAMKVLPEFRLGDFYVFSGMSLQWKSWQACQSLNDKRIQQLLAVIAKKDESLKLSAAVFSGEILDKSGMIKSLEILRDSLSIKPENVELVEVGSISQGDIFIHSDLQGVDTTIYAIKTKEPT